MQIIPMNTMPLGAIMLDIAVMEREDQPRVALVISEELNLEEISGLAESCEKVYWAGCPTPAIVVLNELGRMGGLQNVNVHVQTAQDAHVEYIFMNGEFTREMTEAQMQKALAA